MSIQNKGLGKGLGALLSVEDIPETTLNSVIELKINDINPNMEQPRKKFEETALQELASSIQENGIIQPIIVIKKDKGYKIVAGERRWRAARLAGLKTIPAIIRDLTDQETLEQALIENIQRQDLNPLEEAFAMHHLMKEHKMTQEQLAKKLGKSRPAIANTLRLMALDDIIKDYIKNGDLSAGHGRALLVVSNSVDQIKLAEIIIEKDLSVRETEDVVKKYLLKWDQTDANELENRENNNTEMEALALLSISSKEVEKKLTQILGTKVKLKVKDQRKGKGNLIIEYLSYEDLDRIIEVLNK